MSVLYAPRHALLAREAAAQARTPVPLPGFGPVAAADSTVIILAPTPAAFAEATGGRAPEWAGGVAIPSLRRIVIPAYPLPGVDRRQADAILRHELVHLALHERLPGAIPRWFDEGYAEVASGSWDSSEGWALRVAFLTGRAPPLDSLSIEWPSDEADARLAYLLSATAVDHLRRRTGERGFALLMRNWQASGSLESSIRTTFGMTSAQLEDEWGRDVRSRYGWLSLGASLGFVWALAVVLAMVAWIPRRMRNRARVAEMEKEYRMLPPPREDGLNVEYPLAFSDERD
ncbi:peptidase MA family metallohydrolase [Longimicrobium terrae]|uniref:Peptidase MA-like domain-containing protein n=1 Tax=Longimicrobium terrae TaxID=1639882 RepID=A0A841H4K0_9BACT|nr:hypothetical protein [Longimicrobium terrae]MBB4638536.1 hypothetical protein [Longimicrobium terrae]MBB6072826.1 hypothetical protein [Longimicrobium terrae]NNC30557.1 hypothetical protein [Longimicrobium terrae]